MNERKELTCVECGIDLSTEEIEDGVALCWACLQWHEDFPDDD